MLNSHDKDTRSVKEVFATITENMSLLVRAELELFKVEMKEEGKKFSEVAAIGVAAAVFGVLTVIFLFVSVLLGLAQFVPDWAAALILTAVMLLTTVVLALAVKKKVKSLQPKPEETIETLKEDKKWAETQIKSVKK